MDITWSSLTRYIKRVTGRGREREREEESEKECVCTNIYIYHFVLTEWSSLTIEKECVGVDGWMCVWVCMGVCYCCCFYGLLI